MTTTTISSPPVARFTLLVWLERITSNFLLRRLLKALFTIWFVTSITFFVVRAMPGNAVDILLQELTAQGMSPDDARNQAASLMGIKLDEPVYLQSEQLAHRAPVLERLAQAQRHEQGERVQDELSVHSAPQGQL